MNIIGIDPGKSGAAAVLEAGQSPFIVCTPTIMNGKKKEYDVVQMATTMHVFQDDVDCVFIEKVHAMPGQGVVSMFSMGQGFGLWIGIVAALGIPYELVTPQRWKKEMLADVEGSDNKARSLIAAKRLFPETAVGWKKKDHDKAEALLIAEYGRRRLNRRK